MEYFTPRHWWSWHQQFDAFDDEEIVDTRRSGTNRKLLLRRGGRGQEVNVNHFVVASANHYLWHLQGYTESVLTLEATDEEVWEVGDAETFLCNEIFARTQLCFALSLLFKKLSRVIKKTALAETMFKPTTIVMIRNRSTHKIRKRRAVEERNELRPE